MNPLYASLSRLHKRLADAGIASAVIGGIAVSVWSRPRTTDDIMKWLRALEQALDDSTLVANYQRLRAKYSS